MSGNKVGINSKDELNTLLSKEFNINVEKLLKYTNTNLIDGDLKKNTNIDLTNKFSSKVSGSYKMAKLFEILNYIISYYPKEESNTFEVANEESVVYGRIFVLLVCVVSKFIEKSSDQQIIEQFDKVLSKLINSDNKELFESILKHPDMKNMNYITFYGKTSSNLSHFQLAIINNAPKILNSLINYLSEYESDKLLTIIKSISSENENNQVSVVCQALEKSSVDSLRKFENYVLSSKNNDAIIEFYINVISAICAYRRISSKIKGSEERNMYKNITSIEIIMKMNYVSSFEYVIHLWEEFNKYTSDDFYNGQQEIKSAKTYFRTNVGNGAFKAVNYGHSEIIALCININTPPNFGSSVIHRPGFKNTTPIHKSAFMSKNKDGETSEDHVKIFKIMIENEISAKSGEENDKKRNIYLTTDDSNNTFLHYAIKNVPYGDWVKIFDYVRSNIFIKWTNKEEETMETLMENSEEKDKYSQIVKKMREDYEKNFAGFVSDRRPQQTQQTQRTQKKEYTRKDYRETKQEYVKKPYTPRTFKKREEEQPSNRFATTEKQTESYKDPEVYEEKREEKKSESPINLEESGEMGTITLTETKRRKGKGKGKKN